MDIGAGNYHSPNIPVVLKGKGRHPIDPKGYPNLFVFKRPAMENKFSAAFIIPGNMERDFILQQHGEIFILTNGNKLAVWQIIGGEIINVKNHRFFYVVPVQQQGVADLDMILINARLFYAHAGYRVSFGKHQPAHGCRRQNPDRKW